MKKLFITASFLIVLLGSAFCVNKIYDTVTAAAGTEVWAVEAMPIYMEESSGLAPLEAASAESLVVRDKPMALEAVVFLGRNREVAEEMLRRSGMAGRLVVPSAGIDVALFTDGPGADEAEIRQNICDQQDSAAFFTDGLGMLIADHNNQAFSVLNQVQLGDKAVILRGHSIVTLECSLITDGYNYGKGILDEDGYYISSYEDYICYTCKEDWNNVRVVGFSILDEDYVI